MNIKIPISEKFKIINGKLVVIERKAGEVNPEVIAEKLEKLAGNEK